MTDRDHIDTDTLARLRHGGPERAEELAKLAGDAAVRETLDEWDRQDAALRALYGPVADEPVPDRLRALVDDAAIGRRSRSPLFRIAAALVLLAIGAAGGWGTARYLNPGAPGSDLADVALRAYAAYTPEIVHPVEVSADQHDHLTTWLSKRVGQKFALPDLSAEGFTLLGGRIVPDEHGVAALLMYEDAQGRRVTMVVASEPEAEETGFRYAAGRGVESLWWYGDGLGCAIVAELPRDRLKALAVIAYRQLLPA